MADKQIVGEIAVRLERAIERSVSAFEANCDFAGETPEEVAENKRQHAEIMRGHILTGMGIATSAMMKGDGIVNPTLLDEAIHMVAKSYQFERQSV